MIDFLVTSTVSLSVFLGFYHLVLEREKIHQFNRFYLLFAILISFAIPFLTFEIIKIVPVVQAIEPLNTIVTSSGLPENEFQEINGTTSENINYTRYILWSFYGIISVLLLVKFGKNIWKLISKSKSNPIVKYNNATLVLIQEKTLPHTFLNYIFINFDDYNNRTIEEELYAHELVHVNQKHTLDILFIELLKVLFWFNPLFVFFKKTIQLNHEFLADEAIVKTYNNVPFYQDLLLQKSSNVETIYLASNLNYSVTKKRLLMMTKNTSQKIAVLKKIAIVPILAGLIYFFCIEVVAKEKVIRSKSEIQNSEITDKDKIRDSYYSGDTIKNKNTKNNNVHNYIKIDSLIKNIEKYEQIQSNVNDKKAKKIIVIDAGHGGYDFGASNEEWNEKNLTSLIAKKIKEMYSDSNIEIHFTRTSDEFIELKERTNFINTIKPDLVISLHFNYNKNTDANGFEIFISDKNNLIEESKVFAEKLSAKLSKTQLRDRGLKFAPFLILKNSLCPSMLVELGFISNENDRKFISSEKGQTEIAKRIVDFISEIK